MAGTDGERETISEQDAINFGDEGTEPGNEGDYSLLARTLEPPTRVCNSHEAFRSGEKP